MANHPNRRKAKPAPDLWYPTQPIEEFADGFLTKWFNSELARALKDYVEDKEGDCSYLGLKICSGTNDVSFWIDVPGFFAERATPIVKFFVEEIEMCSHNGKITAGDRPPMLLLRKQLAEVLAILDSRLSA